ncbi:MAG: hypothetical protein J07HX5_00293 [halophilic archaeon J07HX5]|nr:MAG: hypothetical protein J07HX5_00293 [halophilic archaeon J07HX5]
MIDDDERSLVASTIDLTPGRSTLDSTLAEHWPGQLRTGGARTGCEPGAIIPAGDCWSVAVRQARVQGGQSPSFFVCRYELWP